MFTKACYTPGYKFDWGQWNNRDPLYTDAFECKPTLVKSTIYEINSI